MTPPEQPEQPVRMCVIAWAKAIYALCWFALVVLITAIALSFAVHVLVRELLLGWRLGQ